MSDEIRGSEPVMTAKDAIMEIRADVKGLLAFAAAQEQANLPSRMDTAESQIEDVRSDVRSMRSWVLGIAVAVGTLGGGSIILQLITVAARGAPGT